MFIVFFYTRSGGFNADGQLGHLRFTIHERWPRHNTENLSLMTPNVLAYTQGRRHEFHYGEGVQNSEFASEANEKNFLSPPIRISWGYMHDACNA